MIVVDVRAGELPDPPPRRDLRRAAAVSAAGITQRQAAAELMRDYLQEGRDPVPGSPSTHGEWRSNLPVLTHATKTSPAGRKSRPAAPGPCSFAAACRRMCRTAIVRHRPPVPAGSRARRRRHRPLGARRKTKHCCAPSTVSRRSLKTRFPGEKTR
ncbi:hypothetical protein M8494_37445 [Serratia ureilytica]